MQGRAGCESGWAWVPYGERMIVVQAPAKLTVSLRVLGTRPDGYHLIDAEMVSLDLCDTLEISEGDGLEVVGQRGLPIAADADNLVSRALAAVGRRAHVRLVKQIPAGAGLGGGSSDAAAVLAWAGITEPQVAAGIGADVAFCVAGGRARVTGIGDELEALPFEARTYTLVTPPFGCSTVAVYAAWDRLGGPRGDHGNDLEPAALDVEPRLAAFRDELAEDVGVRPRLAGSGSTWFVEGSHPAPGRVVATTVPARG